MHSDGYIKERSMNSVCNFKKGLVYKEEVKEFSRKFDTLPI